MVNLLDYLAMAEKHSGTNTYLGFGATIRIICHRYGIDVDYDCNEIIVYADAETIANIEF